MSGLTALSETPLSTLTDSDTLFGSPFQTLLDNPALERRFLVTLIPFKFSTGSTTALRFSTHGFQTLATDSPANAAFEARVISAFNASVNIINGDRIGKVTSVVAGEIVFNNMDGGLDDWATDYSWSGRNVTVRMGGKDFAYDDYQVIFRGRIDGIEWDYETVRLRIRDKSLELDNPIQTNVYTGSTNDGGEDLEGQPKPLVFGNVFNILPPQISSSLVYQVHDGAVASIAVVRDRGAALIVAVGTTIVSAGYYLVDQAAGTFTLGGQPDGSITADVYGLTSTTAEIVRSICTTYASMTAADLDLGSFSEFSTVVPHTIGLWVGPEERTTRSVLTEVLDGAGGWGAFTRTGLFQIGTLSAASVTEFENFNEESITQIHRHELAPPTSKVRVRYRRNFHIQENDVAGVVNSSARREFAREGRYVAVTNSAVVSTTRDPAIPMTFSGLFAVRADASTEASRHAVIYTSARSVFRIVTKDARAVNLDLGRRVLVSVPRYGLSAGRLLTVVGMNTDFDDNETTIDLFG